MIALLTLTLLVVSCTVDVGGQIGGMPGGWQAVNSKDTYKIISESIKNLAMPKQCKPVTK